MPVLLGVSAFGLLGMALKWVKNQQACDQKSNNLDSTLQQSMQLFNRIGGELSIKISIDILVDKLAYHKDFSNKIQKLN